MAKLTKFNHTPTLFYSVKAGFFIKRFFPAFLVVLLFTFSAQVHGQTADTSGYTLRKVVIDAGHGGRDPGTIGKHSYEKNIALAIALKLGNYIKENLPDVQVIYTRKSDKLIELYHRGDIANEAKADLFISIHCNSNPNKNITGTETYVMGLNKNQKNMDVARKENAVISLEDDFSLHYEGYDPNSEESFILFSLMQNTYLEQSLEFASLIQEQFGNRAHRKNRGVRQGPFVVLWKTSMPSVLIETGFLSNPTEENYLLTDEGQSIIASAIFRAFRKYKSTIENRSSFTLHPTAKTDTIHFGVQVASSRNPLDKTHPLYKRYKDLLEIEDGQWYKYITGSTASYEEVKKERKEITGAVPDAFIVAIKNGKIIPVHTALSEIKE